MTTPLSSDVSYNPNTHSIFFTTDKQGNKAIGLIEYNRELYPEKSWLELLVLSVPELEGIENKETLKFYLV